MKEGIQYSVTAPQSPQEALVRALKLALTASTDARMNMAIMLAEDIARGLSEFDVARCKKQALKELSEEQV